jgi:hypothetical protein
MRFAHGVRVQAAGAQDITDHWANPQGAQAKPERRAHQANPVCDCARFAQCAVMLNAGSARVYPGRLPGRGGLDARCGLLQRSRNARTLALAQA